MMYSAVLLLYAILKQRDGVPKTGKGAEGHGARERLLTIHLMELLRKDGKYATKLGLEPSIKVRVYGDNVFEKHGINRDRTGDGEKPRCLCGKRGIFNRDGAANYQTT